MQIHLSPYISALKGKKIKTGNTANMIPRLLCPETFVDSTRLEVGKSLVGICRKREELVEISITLGIGTPPPPKALIVSIADLNKNSPLMERSHGYYGTEAGKMAVMWAGLEKFSPSQLHVNYSGLAVMFPEISQQSELGKGDKCWRNSRKCIKAPQCSVESGNPIPLPHSIEPRANDP